MKRIIPLFVIATVVTSFALKDRWFPRVQQLLPNAAPHSIYLGYVEAETTYIAAPVAGRIVSRPVKRGDTITQDAIVFQLDPATAEADVARYTAAIQTAKANLANLQTGKREEEQDVVRAQRKEAEAALALAEKELKRNSTLVSGGIEAQERLDVLHSQAEQLRARIEQLRAQEAAGDLGGRMAELDAAEARVQEAEASLAGAQSHLQDLAPRAPLGAVVDDTFYDVGEWVTAGQPVASLLAPDQIKLRFFVPEKDVALAQRGNVVDFSCDNCPAGLQATITYVAPRVEYTPPVIYSESARDKLVFLVEALPTAPNDALRPGLPVEVNRFAGATP